VTREFARHGGGEYEGVPLDDIIFQIDGRELLGIVLVLAFLFVPIGISLFPYKGDPAKPPFERLQRRMGLGRVNSGLLFVAIALWTMILGSLVLGLLAVIWSFILSPIPEEGQIWNWRFSLAKMAALTATLGAVVALPFTLIRLTFTRTQTETAVEALFNDKINAAVDDLHAQRQVSELITDGGTQHHETVWRDDITRRNGAIDRLEGLVQENPTSAERIARMLSVYVRELSQEYKAIPTPEISDTNGLKEWAQALKPARSDMQNAVQVLGRLQRISGVHELAEMIDLTGANLQGFDLTGLFFDKSKMNEVHLHGASLGAVRLHGAQLIKAKLLEARLHLARLQGTRLDGAEFQGADLTRAEFRGADLTFAKFSDSTNFSEASFRGAAAIYVDFTDCSIGDDQLQSMFGNATVTLPGGHGPDHANWPKHWSKEKLDWKDFEARWRAFQASIGQDPDNPT
jgi:hypothetical protein